MITWHVSNTSQLSSDSTNLEEVECRVDHVVSSLLERTEIVESYPGSLRQTILSGLRKSVVRELLLKENNFSE